MTDGNVTLSIPSAYTHPATHPASMITGLATVATSGKYSDLSGRPSLATVATSGKYSDLSGRPSLATVATSGSYTDLSNKPSIPSSPKAYVTITYRSGASWYRKWSDGFIEQGGTTQNTTAGKVNVTFPIAFSSVVLYIGCTCKTTGVGSNGTNYVQSSTITNSSCVFFVENNQGVYWRACGF